MIIRRLKDLNKIKPEEYDENATEEILKQLEQFDENVNDNARNINDPNNKFNVRNYEYNDNDSADSFDSNFAETDVGLIEIAEKDMKGDYLPKMRKQYEITIVPEDAVMKESTAPNWRMEPIEK